MLMPTFSPDEEKLLARSTRAFAYLAVVLPDGTPHVSPIWFDWDGEHIILNTARGRIKDRALHGHPVVALTITGDDPYKYILVRGPVVGETEEGAYEMICALNEKYRGRYEFPRRPGQVRVTYKIRPERIFSDLT